MQVTSTSICVCRSSYINYIFVQVFLFLMSVCIILCNSAYYGCLHFSLLSSCICISLLRRPKIKLHQVVIKDDDHSALTLTSSFLLLPHLADVEAAAMAFVTLRVTEPDLGSRSTNPRDAKCGFFFMCGGNFCSGGCHGGSRVRRLRLAEPVCHSKDGDLTVPTRPASRVAAVTALWRRNGRLTAR